MEWLETTISDRKDWAPGLATVTVDAAIDFTPGQFTNLGLDLGEKRVRRSYSIASAPGKPMEFYLTEVAGGEFTPTLFSMGKGSKVFVQPRAAGLLTLDYVPEFARDIFLVSTGTGLSPYLSMLRSGRLLERFERVCFVHGVRDAAHLGHEQELRQVAAGEPRVVYVPIISRGEPPAGGLQGRIPKAIASGALEQAVGCELDPARAHVMLCGNPDMVRESIAALIEKGLRKHRQREPGHITQEKYW